MTTAELRPWLREHWGQVREALDAGAYRPSPVRRVVIPKPGGGERLLGVPTVLDRLIQQAIAQEWKKTATKRRNLRQLGIPEQTAHEWGGTSKGYWRIAGSPVLARALPNAYWDNLGLHGLHHTWHRLRPTA